MDPTEGRTAAQLLVESSADELTDILRRFGEEPHARAIARAIERAQSSGRPPTTTAELRTIVARAARAGTRHAHRDPATRTFQALRIAVNHELEELDRLLEIVPERLAPSGRVAILSYHSLEDRRVKQAFRSWAARCICPPELPRCACGGVARAIDLTRQPLGPSESELEQNPRARSARLRAVEWIRRGDD
jgi:16S rRNA (cytosine1402-N4)-methyltransferase